MTAAARRFSTFKTVRHYFYRVRGNSLLDVANAVPVACVGGNRDQKSEPNAGSVDSHSVKSSRAGKPRGYIAGETIKGLKRHIVPPHWA